MTLEHSAVVGLLAPGIYPVLHVSVAMEPVELSEVTTRTPLLTGGGLVQSETD
jgi:hypothetical protein